MFITYFKLCAQPAVVLRGTIVDTETKQPLPFATINIKNTSIGNLSDTLGEFELKIEKGTYILQVSYVGYDLHEMSINIIKDTTISIYLNPSTINIKEVKVTSEAFFGERNLNAIQMSSIKLDPKQIQLIPNIAGEQDLIKVAQLLPGVSKGIEGSSDYFVRGGDADQNLLLLDGATIYNTGHLLGFISVFNPDIIGEATFIKGAFPANHGGRLSSIYDIKTQSTIPKQTEVSTTIGLVSSRLKIRQPLIENKLSILLSGRRSYIDIIAKAMNLDIELPYHFYDANGRIDFQLNNKNKFYISTYLGDDILDYQPTGADGDGSFNSNFAIRSNTQNAGWRHSFSETWVSNLTIARSFFAYTINNSFNEAKIVANSGIEDYILKYTINNKGLDNTGILAGFDLQTHHIDPIVINSEGIIETFFPDSRSNRLNFIEGASFIQTDKDITQSFRIGIGYRQSFAITDQKTYFGYEPRLSARWKTGPYSSIKMSFSRNYQYMHRVSSSGVTLPVDLWYGVTQDIKPQSSNQLALSYVRVFPIYDIVFENELYYKNMNDIIEYEEGTNLMLNTDFEASLLQGKGSSYGIETHLKKDGGNWQGWFSYTLSWSNRQFNNLNGGNSFPSKYDRRHNISIVGQYNLNKRITFSAVWEYISGSKFTPIIGQYSIINPNNSGIDIINIYTERNAVSMSSSHRLDVMLIIKSKSKKRFNGTLNIGVYNVYNRATPIAINIYQDESGNFKYEQPGLFGIIPTISYKIEF